MTAKPYSIPRLAGVLAAVLLALASFVHYLNETSIQQMIKANAQASAEVLTKQLVNDLNDIEAILAGVPPSQQSLDYLKIVSKSGSIGQFELFDKDGTNRLNSRQIAKGVKSGESLTEHRADVLEAVGKGESLVFFEDDAGNSDWPGADEKANQEELVLAESYVPILRKGKVIGVASVYIDQTELAVRLRDQLRRSNLIIMVLSALGFAIPAVGVFQRTRQKQQADMQIAYLAQFDVLTNLLNRKSFESTLGELLLDAAHSGKRVALHFLDLDFFKAINDNYGHAFGDELLREFSKRIKEHLGPGDVAARFGGDEFVVAQTDLGNIEDLATATKTLYNVMTQPLQVMGKTLIPGVSMGTAMYPDNGIDTSILLHCADIALYVVKGQGRNGHRFFEPGFNQARLRRTDLEFLVRKNVVSRNFELHYQPYYSLTDGTLKGFEALLRMRDSQGKYISPAEFVPVAEDLGLINEIGAWVLNEACRFAKDWPEQLKLSVNLSSVQFRKKHACPSVLEALTASGLPANRLVVEITESVLLADVDDVRQQIQQLKAYGVELAMDDFGTGYSSLSYILRLPFDRLKIDRSFVMQMSTGDANALKIVDTIISLGHTMKMQVTAEGVETEEQAQMLQNLGCDDVQGYLFSKPVAAPDVASLIMKSFVRDAILESHDEQFGEGETQTALAG
jgi:diguanylate cyclase (GGDEF)-like protein